MQKIQIFDVNNEENYHDVNQHTNIFKQEWSIIPKDGDNVEIPFQIYQTRVSSLSNTMITYGVANSTSTFIRAGRTMSFDVQPSRYGFDVGRSEDVCYFSSVDFALSIYTVDLTNGTMVSAKTFANLTSVADGKFVVTESNQIIILAYLPSENSQVI